MADIRTYTRGMDGWWTKNTFYVRYMVREFSAFFFFAYGLVLLIGLFRLSQGQEAFDAWRAALAAPLAIGFHVLAAGFAALHTVTWFMVLPKTAPPIRYRGKIVPERTVVVVGTAVSLALSIAFVALVAGAAR